MSSSSSDSLYLDVHIRPEESNFQLKYIKEALKLKDLGLKSPLDIGKEEAENRGYHYNTDGSDQELVVVLGINRKHGHALVYTMDPESAASLFGCAGNELCPGMKVSHVDEEGRYKCPVALRPENTPQPPRQGCEYHVALLEDKYFLIKDWFCTKLISKRAQDMFYVGKTQLTKEGADILALMVVGTKYKLTKADCLEFAKRFAMQAVDQSELSSEVEEMLEKITIMTDERVVSSEMISRNTEIGQAAASSEAGAVRSSQTAETSKDFTSTSDPASTTAVTLREYCGDFVSTRDPTSTTAITLREYCGGMVIFALVFGIVGVVYYYFDSNEDTTDN